MSTTLDARIEEAAQADDPRRELLVLAHQIALEEDEGGPGGSRRAWAMYDRVIDARDAIEVAS
jgi:hypothetical protein